MVRSRLRAFGEKGESMFSAYLLTLFAMLVRSNIINILFWTNWWAVVLQCGWYPAGFLSGAGIVMLKYKLAPKEIAMPNGSNSLTGDCAIEVVARRFGRRVRSLISFICKHKMVIVIIIAAFIGANMFRYERLGDKCEFRPFCYVVWDRWYQRPCFVIAGKGTICSLQEAMPHYYLED